MAAKLKLFKAMDDGADVDFAPEPNVRIRLGDLLPLVAMADKLNFIWLKDFLDDEVAITDDLHEVLQAFRAYRPSA